MRWMIVIHDGKALSRLGIPTHLGRVFRRKSATYSEGNRPPATEAWACSWAMNETLDIKREVWKSSKSKITMTLGIAPYVIFP